MGRGLKPGAGAPDRHRSASRAPAGSVKTTQGW